MERLLTDIAENVRRVRCGIEEAAVRAGRDPAEIRLMAVTKTQSAQLVNEAIAAGVTLLGENKAQELCEKYDRYSKTGPDGRVDVHFIGHLQTNKVRQVVGKASTVQSVDSLRLAKEISGQSEKLGICTEILIEVNIAGEQSKSGAAPEAAEELAREIALLPAIKLRGLMAIPPVWDNNIRNERFFASMNQILVDIRGKNIDNIHMEILSMGMSNDFAAAVKHGSTLVRLGSAIFGPRN